MFPDKQHDFVISVSETDIAIVKEVKKGISVKELIALAKAIEDTVNAELYIKTVTASAPYPPPRDPAGSFKAAQVAIDGQSLDTERPSSPMKTWA